MPANLDTSLLYKIMQYLGDHRDVYPNWVNNTELLSIVPELMKSDGQDRALFYVDRHCVFLQDQGFLKAGTPTLAGHRVLRLSTKGEMFVQPDLAEFGTAPLLPQVVESLEKSIQVLSYPEEEKNGMLFHLREAVAKQAPDVIAKAVAEIGFKLLKGGS
jgi:hypothetical protein